MKICRAKYRLSKVYLSRLIVFILKFGNFVIRVNIKFFHIASIILHLSITSKHVKIYICSRIRILKFISDYWINFLSCDTCFYRNKYLYIHMGERVWFLYMCVCVCVFGERHIKFNNKITPIIYC